MTRVYRRRDLGVLIAAIAVAVAASTTVGMFTDRLQRAIRVESATVLAADLRLESGRGPESLDEPERYARQSGLRTARTTSFTTVIHAGDAGQLATIIATNGDYPLRGELRLSREAYGPAQTSSVLPLPGFAYVDPRIANRLAVTVGDEIRLGAIRLHVAAILTDRPDRGSSMADIAPAILVREGDLSSSGLLGAASRATYVLLVAGDLGAVDRYAQWLKARKASAEKLITVAQSSAQLGSATERAGQFLHLAAVTTVLLAAIALAMASRRYAARRRDEVALLKCLGATRKMIVRRFASEAFISAGLGGALGVVIGIFAQLGLAELALVFTNVSVLPAPGVMPALLGLLTAFFMMAGFGLPPIVELARIPPTRIFREGALPRPLPLLVPAIAAVITLLVVLYLYVRDLKLVFGAGIALGLAALIYALLGLGLTRLLRRLKSNAGHPWRFGAAALARRSRETISQIVAFGLGMTILLLLGVVRTDLMEEWQRALPVDAPNHFLLNIAPSQRESVNAFFSNQGADINFAPWVRARLVSVNDRPLSERMPITERGRAFAEREQNLTISSTLPADNKIVQGRWWPASGPAVPTVSVATEFRDELKLEIGDRLLFDVAGETVAAVVGSVRQVRWDGFRPNFFLVFSPGILEENVGSYLAAVHLSPQARQSLAEFDRQFPTITVLDVEGLLASIRALLDRAAAAVTYVFVFTLLAGIVVLAAGINATADERRYESALLRSFGAARRHVLLVVCAEFMTLGALSGLVAATAAAAIGIFVATHWLNLPWRPHASLWLFSVASGVIGIGFAGVISAWRVSLAPPIRILRGE
jgi:putative ABC transport system permease protein